MSKQREALEIALNALEEYQQHGTPFWKCDLVVKAIREALAEPEQEPVAWIKRNPTYEYGTPNPCNIIECVGRNAEDDFEPETPLYTAPPTRKPLTEPELWDAFYCDTNDDCPESFRQFMHTARLIECAHGISNE